MRKVMLLCATLLAIALAEAPPASASYVLADVCCGIPGSPFQQTTNTPGQQVSITNAEQDLRAETMFGAGHLYSATGNATGVANSEFVVDFTLSAAATLGIHYHYDWDIYDSGAQLIVDTSGPGGYHLLHASDSTNPTNFGDFCDGIPGYQPPNACAGAHSGTGVLMAAFDPGPNQIHLTLNTNTGTYGHAYAWNTGEITAIDVPAGVTWSYTDLSGNPLNFQYASTPVPEPASLALAGAGLAGLGALRRRRMA